MDEVILRGVERMMAVGIGGLAVVLGYRLFLRVPDHRDSQGKIHLPGGASIYLARVGPGVFFALFGAAVVGLSLYYGIVSAAPQGDGTRIYAGVSPVPSAEPRGDLARQRLLLRLQVEFLNGLPAWARPTLGETERRELAARTHEIKAALMERVWGPDWGARDAFRLWVEAGAQDPVPAHLAAAAQYFRAGEERHP